MNNKQGITMRDNVIDMKDRNKSNQQKMAIDSKTADVIIDMAMNIIEANNNIRKQGDDLLESFSDRESIDDMTISKVSMLSSLLAMSGILRALLEQCNYVKKNGKDKLYIDIGVIKSMIDETTKEYHALNDTEGSYCNGI